MTIRSRSRLLSFRRMKNLSSTKRAGLWWKHWGVQEQKVFSLLLLLSPSALSTFMSEPFSLCRTSDLVPNLIHPCLSRGELQHLQLWRLQFFFSMLPSPNQTDLPSSKPLFLFWSSLVFSALFHIPLFVGYDSFLAGKSFIWALNHVFFCSVVRGHIEDVYDICWTRDGNCMISGSVDNTAIMWDIKKGLCLCVLATAVISQLSKCKLLFSRVCIQDRSCASWMTTKATFRGWRGILWANMSPLSAVTGRKHELF